MELQERSTAHLHVVPERKGTSSKAMKRLIRLFTAHADKLAAGVAIVIACLSLLPRATASGVPVDDTLGHLAAYCGLSVCAVFRRRTPTAFALMLAIVIGFGGLLELIQPYFGRADELSDFLANTCGALIGATVAVAVRRSLPAQINNDA